VSTTQWYWQLAHGIASEQDPREVADSPILLAFGLALAYKKFTVAAVLGNTDCFADCDASGGAFNLDLPSSISRMGPRLYLATKDLSGFNGVTIRANPTAGVNGPTLDTLNGVAGGTYVLQTPGSMALCMYRDLGNWLVLPWGSSWPDVVGLSASRSAAQSGSPAVSGGWGAGASAAFAANSKNMTGEVDVTTGSSGFGANPTVTVTFAGGLTLPAAPMVAIWTIGAGGPAWAIVSTSTTGFVAARTGTPGAGATEKFGYLVVGK
jgi:hypothetical protein